MGEEKLATVWYTGDLCLDMGEIKKDAFPGMREIKKDACSLNSKYTFSVFVLFLPDAFEVMADIESFSDQFEFFLLQFYQLYVTEKQEISGGDFLR